MSGGSDKTEKPTPKRLSDARQRGQVAKSNDLTAAVVLGAVSLILMLYGSYFFNYMCRLGRKLLWQQLRVADTLTTSQFDSIFKDLMMHIIIVLLPFLIGAMIAAIIINVFQVRFLFTLEPLKPNLNKLNFIQGFGQLFSQKSLVELIKGIVKMTIVGVCGFSIIKNHQDHLMSMSQMGFAESWILIVKVAFEICSTIAMVMLVLGAADWWYQRFQLMKQLRMTRQEVKDEMKNMEGNPEVKRKIKSTGQSILRQQMMKAIPTADVIITNPTHFAVAIQYDPDEAPAPRVVAKGADHMAFQIREIAKANGVPIVENKPLARSMFASVEVGHMIPPELFVAVAEVLAYVFKKNKGRHKRAVRRAYEGGGRR